MEIYVIYESYSIRLWKYMLYMKVNRFACVEIYVIYEGYSIRLWKYILFHFREFHIRKNFLRGQQQNRRADQELVSSDFVFALVTAVTFTSTMGT